VNGQKHKLMLLSTALGDEETGSRAQRTDEIRTNESVWTQMVWGNNNKDDTR